MPRDTTLAVLVTLLWGATAEMSFVDAVMSGRNSDSNSKIDAAVYVTKSNASYSWYGAELSCRKNEGHLLSFTSPLAQEVVDKFPETDTDTTYWVGARKMPGGKWEWADGSEYEGAAVNERFDEPMTSTQTPICMYVEWKEQAVLKAGPCEKLRKYLCSASGDLDYAWPQVDLTIKSADIHGEKFPIKIKPSGIVSEGGVEMGIGEWETPSRISVSLRNDCLWRAVFSVDFQGELQVMTGCEGRPLKKSTLEETKASLITAYKIKNKGTDAPMPPIPNGFTDAPPSTTNAPPDVKLVEEEANAIPMWVWPLAFISVALVSAMMAVGAARRRGRSPKEKQVENVEMENKPEPKQRYDPSAEVDHEAAADCEVCQTFSEDSAKIRLVDIHMALQKQFCAPFNVVSTRCHHVGNEHVHVFSVENDLDAHSLGALSTVYSRKKPRLPKNTRIHIEHCKPTRSLDDESDEEAPKPVDPQEEDQQYSESEGDLETGYDVDTLKYHFD
eukprot:TRINITY_DN581_c0_g1_i1.p1 TRINITY_DN581_c0_g1~~TRINITY_DN581_c0_g1_i1.p1  ORF type:complete len:518 (+),score=62.63 TRINITY_DN581_c0_g1_i1:52-1554(+)